MNKQFRIKAANFLRVQNAINAFKMNLVIENTTSTESFDISVPQFLSNNSETEPIIIDINQGKYLKFASHQQNEVYFDFQDDLLPSSFHGLEKGKTYAYDLGIRDLRPTPDAAEVMRIGTFKIADSPYPPPYGYYQFSESSNNQIDNLWGLRVDELSCTSDENGLYDIKIGIGQKENKPYRIVGTDIVRRRNDLNGMVKYDKVFEVYCDVINSSNTSTIFQNINFSEFNPGGISVFLIDVNSGRKKTYPSKSAIIYVT